MQENLRPLERRVVAMRRQGLDHAEIAQRIRRSPDHVGRILEWSQIPRSGPPPRRYPEAMETRVLDLRSQGESHETIAERFRRSPGFIRRVEGLAHFRRAIDLLS